MTNTELYDALIHDLKRDEGVKLKPYKCTAGKLTTGVGRNLDDVGITEEESDILLKHDLDRVLKELTHTFGWFASAPFKVQLGLGNMCFNLGLPRFRGFKKMLAALERGDYAEAANEALESHWARQVGDRAMRIATLFRTCQSPNN